LPNDPCVATPRPRVARAQFVDDFQTLHAPAILPVGIACAIPHLGIDERTVSASVDCCATVRTLRAVIDSAPAAVVQTRVLPVPSMFPSELRGLPGALPFEVRCAVAQPSVLEAAGVKAPRLGEVLLFAGGRLLGRLEPELADKRARLLGLLKAGLAPWMNTGAPTEPADDDPFAVIGVPRTAGFDEVHAAWRQKLAEYHPDRFARAGEKIRTLANDETQRLNAAFQAIAGARAARTRS
jgi:hypothetical protein